MLLHHIKINTFDRKFVVPFLLMLVDIDTLDSNLLKHWRKYKKRKLKYHNLSSKISAEIDIMIFKIFKNSNGISTPITF